MRGRRQAGWIGIALAGLVAGAAVRADAGAPQPAAARPNVILIMADDFGYELLGCNGGTSYRTPHFDRLAAGGARFEHCYVQPLCTPTRVQLMTGQYNVRNYVEFGTLDPGERTFAHLFREAGYATCIAGKWQLGRDFALPGHFGFDEYCLWQLTRRPGRYKNAGLEINGREVDATQGEYGPDLVHAYALEFIERAKDRPFLLYYPMMLTHGPYVPTPNSPDYATAPSEGEPAPKGKAKQRKTTAPAADAEQVPRKVKGQPNRYFADMVEYTDQLLGTLVERLDRLGLRERTLIVFLGDNGTGAGTKSQWNGQTFTGGKGRTDASGMRVPLIVHWPGRVPAGRVVSDLVDSTDLLPTICAAAGIDVPSDRPMDGVSFLPAACGSEGPRREWIYCWYARGGGAKAQAEFVRDARLKLYRDGRLFDVRQEDLDRRPLDVGELSAADQAALDRLRGVLEKYADARPARLAGSRGSGK